MLLAWLLSTCMPCQQRVFLLLHTALCVADTSYRCEAGHDIHMHMQYDRASCGPVCVLGERKNLTGLGLGLGRGPCASGLKYCEMQRTQATSKAVPRRRRSIVLAA